MKKKNYGVSAGQIILIILVSTVLTGLIVIVWFFVDMSPNIKSQFTIYKEECVKEIQEIGLDYYNEERYGENYNITSYEIRNFGFYKLDDDFCIDYISSQTNKSFILMSSKFYDKGVGLECIGREITLINKNYYNISSKIEYLISVEETKEIFPELNFDESKVYIKNGVIYNKNKYFWVVIDTIRNKSICEKVEVDIKSFCLEIMGEMNKDYCGREDFEKGLTKTSWLDENCNCLDICEDLSCSNRDKCKYYECFEDYFIEVN